MSGNIRLRSQYDADKAPMSVSRWEKRANDAPSDTAALVQLAYFQALEIRAIKLVLIWTLIILPIVLVIGFMVLNAALIDGPHQ